MYMQTEQGCHHLHVAICYDVAILEFKEAHAMHRGKQLYLSHTQIIPE